MEDLDVFFGFKKLNDMSPGKVVRLISFENLTPLHVHERFIFEIKNHFPNFQTILEFVDRGSNVGYKSENLVYLVFDIGNN